MATHIGLYYPFMHFKDEGWLKLTALYWDGMKRIVPEGYSLHDSDEVNTLRDAGFIQNESPEPAVEAVAEPFQDLLRQHGEALGQRFGVARRDDWPEDPHTRLYAPKGADHRLAYVFGSKMGLELLSDLYACGLVTSRSDDPRWIGMHPKLAELYMIVLAEKVAQAHGAYPLTDEAFDHVAVSGYTMERLAAALLGDASLAGPRHTERELEETMASLAFSYVVPANPAAVPAAKIVELRKTHAEDRALFQAEVAKLVGGLKHLEGVEDASEVERQLRSALDKTLVPRLEGLRGRLRDAGIGIAESAIATTFSVPPGLALLLKAVGISLSAGAALGIGLVLGAWTIWRKWEKEKTEALKSSPEAYLYHVSANMKPGTLIRDVSASSGAFMAYR